MNECIILVILNNIFASPNLTSTRIGYTLGLVPTLIKLSTINKLMRAGTRFQRADIDKIKFKRIMIIASILLVLYLTMWTIFDIPCPKNDYRLSKDTNLVTVYTGCASSSFWWEILALSYEAMLLIAITVLTFFSRGVIEELNESRSLSFMVYSHFLFLVMRVLLLLLMSSDMIPNALYVRIASLLISSDTLVALSVYFFPKFYTVFTASQYYRSKRSIHMKSRKNQLNKKDSSTILSSANVERNESKSRYRQINGVRIPQGTVCFS